jgi:hypothetical protein
MSSNQLLKSITIRQALPYCSAIGIENSVAAISRESVEGIALTDILLNPTKLGYLSLCFILVLLSPSLKMIASGSLCRDDDSFNYRSQVFIPCSRFSHRGSSKYYDDVSFLLSHYCNKNIRRRKNYSSVLWNVVLLQLSVKALQCSGRC